MANWFFYDEQGNKYGPNTAAQITELVQRGVITPKTRMVDAIGRQGFAGQIPGLFPYYTPQDFGQYDEEEEQGNSNGGYAIFISLGIGSVVSILTFLLVLFGINRFQKASFYAQYQENVSDSIINAAWEYHHYFNGWALTGSIMAAVVVFGMIFGVALLISWLIAKNKS